MGKDGEKNRYYRITLKAKDENVQQRSAIAYSDVISQYKIDRKASFI